MHLKIKWHSWPLKTPIHWEFRSVCSKSCGQGLYARERKILQVEKPGKGIQHQQIRLNWRHCRTYQELISNTQPVTTFWKKWRPKFWSRYLSIFLKPYFRRFLAENVKPETSAEAATSGRGCNVVLWEVDGCQGESTSDSCAWAELDVCCWHFWGWLENWGVRIVWVCMDWDRYTVHICT